MKSAGVALVGTRCRVCSCDLAGLGHGWYLEEAHGMAHRRREACWQGVDVELTWTAQILSRLRRTTQQQTLPQRYVVHRGRNRPL
jgi:hypothetical protein